MIYFFVLPSFGFQIYIYFIYMKYREREFECVCVLNLLDYTPNAQNKQGLARLEPEAGNTIRISYVGDSETTLAITHCLLGCTSVETRAKRKASV